MIGLRDAMERLVSRSQHPVHFCISLETTEIITQDDSKGLTRT